MINEKDIALSGEPSAAQTLAGETKQPQVGKTEQKSDEAGQADANGKNLTQKKQCKRRRIVRFAASNAAKIAVLTAVSYILYMFVKFPLPFLFPSFLDIQISDLPALLGGFAMGPVSGCLIIVFKCLLKMPFSTTACVGELGDILIGIAFVLPAALIYRFFKNKKGAFWGIILGIAVSAVSALLVNRFLLIPFYLLELYEGNWETFLGMFRILYSEITSETFYAYYLPLAVVPFNILRGAICGGLTFLVYKPLSRALHWEIKSRSC